MDWSSTGETLVGARYTKSSTQCNLSVALRRSTPSELWHTFQPTRQAAGQLTARGFLSARGQLEHHCDRLLARRLSGATTARTT